MQGLRCIMELLIIRNCPKYTYNLNFKLYFKNEYFTLRNVNQVNSLRPLLVQQIG
jgi:hypothetical protein